MKVVINNCYGGFNLSNAAVERCLELGMRLTDYKKPGYEDPTADFVNLKDSLFKDQKYAEVRDYEDESRENKLRCDPRVVQAVRELGDKANGPCSKLKIIEIPFDGPKGWEIDEYDGMESVVPNHGRWC